MDHFSRLRCVVVVAWSVLYVADAAGQAVCYQWGGGGTIGGTPWGWHGTAAAAADEKIALCEAGKQEQQCGCNINETEVTTVVVTNQGLIAGVFPAFTFNSECTYTSVSTGSSSSTNHTGQGIGSRENPDGCPAECEEKANESFQVVASGVSDSFLPPVTGCFAGCESFQQANNQHVRTGPTGARDWLLRYKWTGLTCEDPPPTAGVVNESSEECAGGATELEFCAGPQSGDNCGYVNDQYTCLGSLSNDKCFVNADGSRLCAEGAGVPPKPDSGTAGVEATPDAQLETVASGAVTNTYNYYNNVTVSNSSRPAPAGGNPDGTGVVGQDDGTEEEEGEGSVSGGVACDAPPVCEGDPIQCAILAQQWKARCPAGVTDAEVGALLGPNEAIPSEEHDLSSALSTSLISAGGGSCPAAPVINFPIFGSVEITVISWFCLLAAKIAPLLMATAYVGAAFIVGGRM